MSAVRMTQVASVVIRVNDFFVSVIQSNYFSHEAASIVGRTERKARPQTGLLTDDFPGIDPRHRY